MKIGSIFTSIALLGLCAAATVPQLGAQTVTPSTTSIPLSAPANSSSLVTQNLTLNVSGGSNQTLSISASPSWLTVVVPGCTPPTTTNGCSISNPSGSYTVTVQANPTNLASAVFQGAINATLTGAAPVVISVPFTVGNGVGGSSGTLVATPSTLNFWGLPSGATQSQSVTLSNSGNAIAYTASSNVAWLSTSIGVGQGVSPGTLLIYASPLSLAAGSYTGTVTLTPTGGGQTTSITVNFYVATTQQFQIYPSSVNLTYVNGSGAGNPASNLTVGVTTGGNVSYQTVTTYTGQGPTGWLSVPASGTTGTGLAVTATGAAGLPAGTYTANVAFTANNVPTVNIPVTLVVSAAATFQVSPNPITFNIAQSAVSSVPLSISTTTGSVVNYTVTPQAVNWLSVSNANGTTPGSATVVVNSNLLPVGFYSAVLTISSSNSGVAPVNISVNMTVGGVGGGGGVATPTVLLSQSQFVFNAIPNGVVPDQTLTLTSNVGTSLGFALTPSAGATWLQVLNGTGSTPGAPIVRVSTAGLSAGTYTATLLLTAAGASNNGQSIPVTLTVNAANQLQTNPSGANFFYTGQSGNYPMAQNVQVSSTTGASIPVSATATTNSGGAWLSVTPPTVNTAGLFQISVNIAVLQTLGAGTYTGNIVFGSATLNSTVNFPVTLTVTGNTGGGSTVEQLVVGPNPMNFYAPVGGATPAQYLDLNSATGASLNYSISYTANGGSWLNVSPISGTTPAQVVVSASSSNLPAGTYTGSILVTTSGTLVTSTTIPVTLTISANTNIVASPAGVTFVYTAGGSTTNLQRFITITTTTGQVLPLTVTATSSTNQLTVSTSTSSTPAGITVSFNPTGLAAGVYSGTIFVNVNGASNSTLNIPVTMIVQGTGGGGTSQLSLSPTSLNFYGEPGGAPPQQRTVQVTSSISNTSYSVTSNQSWLLAGPVSGTTPGTITIGVNPAGLPVGTHTGNVAVSGNGSTVNLTVNFEVTTNPLLRLSQQSLTFNYQTGQTVPSPRPILITTSNGNAVTATLSATTNSGGNWLLVSPTSLQTPGASAISLATNIVSTLAAGTYTGTVTVSAPGTANSNTSINVTLNVSNTALLTMSTTPITFNAQFNGNAPPSQTRQITSTSTALNVTVNTSTSTGTGWLTAAINTNTTPATLTISATPFGLGTGAYTGSVTVTSGDSSSALVIPVTLNVSSLPLISVDKSELLFGSGGTSGATAQTIQITSSSANFNYTATANVTNSPTNWLTISNATGVTPSALTVTVNPALLNDGTYFGTVTLIAPGTGNTPLVIPVTLTVNNATALQVTPTTLSFTQVQGAAAPTAQAIQVTSQQQVPFTYTTAVQTPIGGNWLSVTQSGGQTNGFLQVSVNSAASSLPAGNYTATITVFGQNSPNSVPVTVNLTVASPNSIVAAPVTLTFSSRVGSPNPPTQTVQISSVVAGTPVPFNVTSDVPWLSAAPTTGTSPTTLTVTAITASFPAGVTTATGHLTIVPTGATGQTATITVTFNVDPIPPPAITSFANAATFQAGSLSPGMIFTVFGTNLGPTTAMNGSVVAGRFTTTLGGARVLFDGIPAPILYASATQINAVVPYGLAGRASSRLSVEYNGVSSLTLEPRIVETNPGIFTTNGVQAAMFNEDGSFNSPANPAVAGTIVVIYLTGEGQTTPAGVDGEVVAATNLKKPVGAVRVRVGGVDIPASEILYAGSAPSLVAGLMQINFRVPASAPANLATPVDVYVGAGQSQSVTMAVRK